MTVISMGGGNAGIKEYLEDGKKQGRELSRDEIDQRIILAGDLDICERIIECRATDAERYDHITLSFKEDDISPEILKAITEDFRQFIHSAFGEDEIYLYAEAHMPKTRTEKKWNSEAKKYEIVDRHPHIHFVIPKTNLVTGERISVFEMLSSKFGGKDKTLEFIDAFQEMINAKYGLASPKDNRRSNFDGKSDMISRIKEDVFTGRNREALGMIRDKLIAEKIESPQAFKKMLEEMGEVSVGNGKGGDYLQIKLYGKTQNVRLKDYQFSAEFLFLPMKDKYAFYAQKGAGRTAEQIVEDTARRENLMHKWTDRAREIKYLTPSSKFYLEHYVKATDAEKTAMLDQLEARHYEKLEKNHGYVNDEFRAKQAAYSLATLSTVDQITAADIHAETARLEEFTSARLNKTYLRTTEQLVEAEAAGLLIIETPDAVVTALTLNQSHFSEADLERHLLKNTDGPEQYEAAMKAVLSSSELVVRKEENGLMLFTSGTIVKIENRLIERAVQLAGATVTSVTSARQQELLDAKPFNPGQRGAFALLCSDKQLAVVNGAAGTGKSFVLAAMREAYESEGFRVHGAILQGKTAEDLERDSGIQSRTIARMLMDLESGRFALDAKTVLVVDEAGMVGSRDLEKLMGYVEDARARLRLVGDAKQLAAVEYGNAFVEVSKRVQVSQLTEIMRQKIQWQRQASEKFASHNIEGLQDYIDRGHVRLEGTGQDAQVALVRDWSIHRLTNPEQSRIVLAHTNAARTELNALMRAELQKQGLLKNGIDVMTSRGLVPVAVGEVVMFTKADRDMGVKNGTSGTVSDISNEGVVTVTLEDGRKTRFSAEQETAQGFDDERVTHIDYGYAVTVHKSQGMTVDATYVLASPTMTKENLGVAMTRHRYMADVYASAEDFASMPAMVKALDRAGDKAFTAGKSWTEEHRKEDSELGQHVANLNAEKAIERAGTTARYKEIVVNLEPVRLLEHLRNSHGIDPAKFVIVADKYGNKGLKVGDKTLNVVEFLTKVVQLDYKKEAVPMLAQCYSEQLAKAYSRPKIPGQVIDQAIQREFSAYVKERDALYKISNLAIGSRKRDAISEIDATDAPAAVNRAARMALNAGVKAERIELKAEHGKHTAQVYKDFLSDKAPQSDKHLDELARVSYSPDDLVRLQAIEVLIERERIKRDAAAAVVAAEKATMELRGLIEPVSILTPEKAAADFAKSVEEARARVDVMVKAVAETQAEVAAQALLQAKISKVQSQIREAQRQQVQKVIPAAAPGGDRSAEKTSASQIQEHLERLEQLQKEQEVLDAQESKQEYDHDQERDRDEGMSV